MKRRGVNYDVGIEFGHAHSRPEFDVRLARREIEIIRRDLHCNAIRISGTDPERLEITAQIAFEQGLEVWLSPHLHDKTVDETLAYTLECARAAERLRQRHAELVFILGCELTVFMHGILPGADFYERIRSLGASIRSGVHKEPLNEFLSRAASAARQEFRGPIGYAAALFEAPDWGPFDLVCLDHYRDARAGDAYARQLAPYFSHGKPVIVTEFGCCTYQGAENAGAMGWAIVDKDASPPQIPDGYVRDEGVQAREIHALWNLLQKAGVDGGFVFTFVAPAAPHSDDPRFDFDMANYALVKTWAGGRERTYPDMPWEPKESFHTVAKMFAAETTRA